MGERKKQEVTATATASAPVLTLREIGKEFGMSGEQMKVITNLIAPKATVDELRLFLYVAKRTGLDPFSKQLYFVKRKDNASGTEKMTVQTGIDGFRAVAGRSKDYAGMDDIVFDIDEPGKRPTKATCTVYKMVGGQRIAFTATARWDEYYPGEKLGFMWRSKPYVMLGKCAEALALRKAFPLDLSGVYVEEEMEKPLAPDFVTAEMVEQSGLTTANFLKKNDDIDTTESQETGPEEASVQIDEVQHPESGPETGGAKG